jgi:hypothetical protein
MVLGAFRVSTPLPVFTNPPVPDRVAPTVKSLPPATVRWATLVPNARVPLEIPPLDPPVESTAPAVRVRVPPPMSTDPPRMRRAFAALAPVTEAGAVTSYVAVELPAPESGLVE